MQLTLHCNHNEDTGESHGSRSSKEITVSLAVVFNEKSCMWARKNRYLSTLIHAVVSVNLHLWLKCLLNWV